MLNKQLPQLLYAQDGAPVGTPLIQNVMEDEPAARPQIRRAAPKPDAPEGLFPLFKGSTLEESAQWIGTHITGYSDKYDDRTAQVPRKLMNLTIAKPEQSIFAGANMSVETFIIRQEARLIQGANGELDGTPYRAQFMWFRVEQPNGYADCRGFKYNKAGFLVVEVRQIHNTSVVNTHVAAASATLLTKEEKAAQLAAVDITQQTLPNKVSAEQEPKATVKTPIGN